MSIKIIKLENLFKSAEAFIKKVLADRFLLYKYTGIAAAIILLVIGAFAFYSLHSQPAAAWYNDSWTRRVQLTIDNSQVAGDLTNFPVLVSKDSSELAGYAKDDGSDIIFTDAQGTKLDRELESYDDATGALKVWVNVPTLYDNADTNLYLYYSNASADEQNSVFTWDGYRAVWHGGNSTSTPAFADSTNNYNNGNVEMVASFGLETQFNATSTYVSTIALSSTTIAIAYQDIGNSSYGTAIACTVNGTAVACGSETVFNNAGTSSVSAAALSDSKFAVAYKDSGSAESGIAVACTVSGTAISCGSETTFNSLASGYTSYISTAMLTSDKFVVVYQDYNGTTRYGTTVACTVTGINVACGSEVVFNSATTNSTVAASLSSDKFVVAYDDNNISGTAVACTVSGTTVACGSETVFNSRTTSYTWPSVLSSTSFALAYGDLYDGSYKGATVVCTVSNITVTCGSATMFNYANTGGIYTATLFDNNFLISYIDYGTASRGIGSTKVCTASGTSVSCGPKSVFQEQYYANYPSAAFLSTTTFVVAYQDYYESTGAYSYGSVLVGTLTPVTATGEVAQSVDFSNNLGRTRVPGSVSSSLSTQSFGQEMVFNAGAIGGATPDRDVSVSVLASDKIAIAYRDNDNSNYGTAIVCTISGAAVTCGSEAIFNSGTTYGPVISTLSAGKFAVAYWDGSNSNYGTAVACTVNVTTIACGSETVYNSAGSPITASAALSNSKFVVAYRDDGNSSHTTAVACTVSGDTTVTCGSETDINSGSMYGAFAAALSDSAFVVAYRDSNNSNYGTVVACTVNVTTVTCGLAVVFNSATTSTPYAAALSSSKFVAVYNDNSTSGNAVACTVNVTTVTCGSETIFNNANTSYPSVAALSADAFIVGYVDAGNSNYGTTVTCSVSSTTVTCSNTEVVFNYATTGVNAMAALSNNKFVMVYRDSTTYGTAIVGTLSSGRDLNIDSSDSFTLEGWVKPDPSNSTSTFLTTHSFGSEAVFNEASTSYPSSAALSANKFVVAYRDVGNSNYGTARACTVSGANISCGGETVFNTAVTGNTSAVTLSADKFAVAYYDIGTANGNAVACTVNDVTIVCGGETTFNASDSDYTSAAALSADKFAVVYQDYGNSSRGTAVACTVNDTTVTCGAETVFNPAATNYTSIAALSADKFAVAYMDSGNASYGTAVACTVSGTTVTCGAETVYNSASSTYNLLTSLSSDKFAVAYRDSDTYGRTAACTVSGTAVTCGSETVFNSAATDSISITSLSFTSFVAIYQDASIYGKAVVCTVFGTTVTCGTQTIFNSAATSYNSVVALTDDKIVVSYRDSTTYGTAIVGYVGGGQFGGETVFNAGTTNYTSVAALSADKFVVVYDDNSNADYGTAVACTVSGTTVTCGSETVFNSAASNYTSAAALSSSSFVVAYMDVGNSNYGTAVICAVSGTTITCGSETVFNSASSSYDSPATLSSDKFVVSYRDVGNSSYGTVKACTVSGTIISCGSGVVFNSAGTSRNFTAALSSSSFAVAYLDEGAMYGNVAACTVSSTVVTCGSEVTFNAAASFSISAATLSSDKFVVSYYDGGNSSYGTVAACAVSGTIVTCGSEAVFNSAATQYLSAAAVTSDRFIVTYQDSGNSNYGTAVACTVSGTIVTCGSETVFNNGDTHYNTVAFLSSDKSAIVYKDVGNSNYGTAIAWQLPTLAGKGNYSMALDRTEFSAQYASTTLYTTLTADTYAHVAMSYDGSTLKLFKNGALITSSSFTDADAPILFTLPGFDAVFGSMYGGEMDEWRLSASARSANWLATEYNNQNAPDTFISWAAAEASGGPVAYWSFDEGYGNTVADRIGGNDGALQLSPAGNTATSSAWVNGQIGKAMSFDGIDDYVSVSATVSDIQSVSLWVKATSTTADILNLDGGTHTITVADGTVSANGFSSPTIYVDNKQNGKITANEWHLLTVTTATAFDASAITLGKVTATFKGIIDEVKLYNRALAKDETVALYSAGSAASASGVGASATLGKKYGADEGITDSLVGYWKFDETSAWGATAGAVKDSSGLNNNGTATNATTTTDKAKFGRSAGFDGTGDYISTAQDIYGGFDGVTVSGWFYTNSTATGKMIYSLEGVYAMYYENGALLPFFDGSSAGDANFGSGYGNSAWHFFAANNDGATTNLYVDGSLVGSRAETLADLADTSGRANVLGGQYDGSANFTGYLDNVKIFNRALSADEVMQEYVSGPAPVGYWRFEEQTGTTAYDASGQGNDGTVANALWKTGGKVGGALKFDGSGDKVTAADSAIIDFDTGSFSVSLWAKHNGAIATNNDYLIAKTDGTNGGYKMYMDSDGDFTVAIDDDSSWTPDDSAATATGTHDDSNWYYVNGVKNGNSSLKLYINGIEMASDNTISALNTISNTGSLYIGIDSDGSSNAWDGYIDDVKLYNYARTTRQIMQDYNNGGPVAYWKFDEGYASTTYDGSGFGNNGSLVNDADWTMDGKFGKALSFDGVNDYVSGGTSPLLGPATNFSVSAWITIGGAGQQTLLYKKDGNWDSAGYYFEVQDSRIAFVGGGSGDFLTGTRPTNGVWHHVAAVVSGTSGAIYVDGADVTTARTLGAVAATSNPFYIGSFHGNASFFNGQIDEVKIYNYARTPEEIRQDYYSSEGGSGKTSAVSLGNKRDENSTWDDGGFGGAAPVGYWRFEEGSGQNVYDVSGNLNNGTIVNNFARVNAGKVGGGLKGTFGRISVPDSSALDITGAVTVEVWIKQLAFTCGTDTITDADGNSYNTVLIGSQCWQASNMRTTKRPDNGYGLGKGPATHGGGGWTADLGYYSCPPNAANNGEDCAAAATLGMLYQWSAAMASSTTAGAQGICPSGWHIPTDDEIKTLEMNWGMSQATADGTGYRGTDEGSRLAGNVADQSWTGGTLTGDGDFGTSGFNLPPAGSRLTSSNYANRAYLAYIWSSLESVGDAWRRNLYYSSAAVNRAAYDKALGHSVRCLKD
ncbi:MAG: DUF2341 domain-containing protein [Methanoregula sp.]|jgi:uncharacterized protein (TIGR02145 family)|nr:DUF2341 domain-containing protein [Methanoregula sp.]